MAEYIEREAFLDALERMKPYHQEADDIAEMLQNFSAADVRPVVLCKDCAHSRKGKQSLECEKHIYAWNNLNRWVNEDDFCSWGVKKEA